MWKLFVLAILPCIVLADDCHTLKQCEGPVRATHFFTDESAVVPTKTSEQSLNEVCLEVPTMKQCVESKLQHCNDKFKKDEVKVFKDIMEYVCTPAGRQVTLDLDKSQCQGDITFETKFNALILGCVGTMAEELAADVKKKGKALTNAEVCPHLSKLDKCVVDGSHTMCGPELAAFVDKIWEISTHKTAEKHDCVVAHHHARRYLEAAMPIMKRSRLF